MMKFDKHFAAAEGKKEDHDTLREQWSKAIDTALLDFFGKDKDNWPRDWHPRKAFDNVLWMRNPGYKSPGLMQYEDQDSKTEIGVVNSKRVADYKAAYLNSPIIQRHVRDAEQAWNAVFVLNDGGVTYLIERLAPVCRPELKTIQIAHQLTELRRKMVEMLDTFYISEDGMEETRKRKVAASNATNNLAHVAEQLRFGNFLSELQINRAELQFALYWSSIGGAGKLSTGTIRPNKERIIDKFLRRNTPPRPEKSMGRGDRAGQIAQRALEHWAGRLRALAQDERRIADLKVDEVTLVTVARELLDASLRTRLEERMADDVRGLRHIADESPAGMLKPAMACAELISRFVQRLNQDALPLAERAQVRDDASGSRPVFAEETRIDVLEDLPEQAEPHFENFIGEWLVSFEHLVDRNAESSAGGANTQHNRRLGEIRTNLGA